MRAGLSIFEKTWQKTPIPVSNAVKKKKGKSDGKTEKHQSFNPSNELFINLSGQNIIAVIIKKIKIEIKILLKRFLLNFTKLFTINFTILKGKLCINFLKRKTRIS